MNKKYTEEDIQYIIDNIEYLSNNEIGAILGRTPVAIWTKVYELGLVRSKEAKLRIRNKRNTTGELNPNWKEGISKNNYHYRKIQKQRYPEKSKARELVASAIRNKSLVKEPCIICGDINSFAHHEDYSKPLDVIWLCRKHHREKHNNKH